MQGMDVFFLNKQIHKRFRLVSGRRMFVWHVWYWRKCTFVNIRCFVAQWEQNVPLISIFIILGITLHHAIVVKKRQFSFAKMRLKTSSENASHIVQATLCQKCTGMIDRNKWHMQTYIIWNRFIDIPISIAQYWTATSHCQKLGRMLLVYCFTKGQYSIYPSLWQLCEQSVWTLIANNNH